MPKQLKTVLKSAASTAAMSTLLLVANPALAQSASDQEDVTSSENDTDVIIVTGILSSLTSALDEKRQSDNIVEVIQAEDIGKLPDQNLAEVLENVTGVQINRTAGVGTGVQIRGTSANRVEINGVSTVGAGNGRSGISFDDLPAAIVASVEVTKVPEARTIEGSVGGTVNLRTLQPLQLTETLLSVRAQGEHSDLSDSITPRFSATIGDNWSTGLGDIGVVFSASYAELDVTSFDPRFDRDREVLPDSGRVSAEAFPFLRTQFLDQQLTNFEYETLNFTGALEWEPVQELRIYVNATINDQTRRQQSARALFSGTGSNAVVDATNNTSFETIDLGTVDGPNGPLVLGSIQAVETGILGVGVLPNGGIDSNLRTSTNTGTRLTDSRVYALGTDWQLGRLNLLFEVSRSTSDSDFPSLNTTLDFINPNGPQPSEGVSADNGVPAIFDARNGTLQFGLAPGLAESPSAADLLNPANYALRGLSQGAGSNKNSETALRIDGSFDSDGILPIFDSIDFGFRFNRNEALNNNASQSNNFTNATTQFFRPRADRFSAFIAPGPDNFDAADGRELFVPDYLVFDAALSSADPQGVVQAVNAAITQANNEDNANLSLLSAPTNSLTSFFNITETTNALYAQGNFDWSLGGIDVRGNAGVRWVDTEISSVGNNVVDGVNRGRIVEEASYNFFLPRASLVVQPAADLLLRAGVSRDLRRPDFDDLSTSIAFGGGANAVVQVGNPSLEPETVWSFDLSGEFYFSDTGFISIGGFHKRRTNLFAADIEFPASPTGPDGQIERDITDPCEGGGIFNPAADRNVFSSVQGTGICVPVGSTFNVDGTTTQTGLEVAFQYSLADLLDDRNFLSGFGVIANLTLQEEGGNVSNFRNGNGDANALNDLLGRTDSTMATATLDDDVVQERVTLTNLSGTAYNMTLFYDKYGVNFRARYSWRSDFVTNSLISFGLPRIVDDRGQLNASISYELTDQITIGVDGINLLREDRTEWCVNDDALLCAQGLSDRRIVGGVSFTF